MTEHTFPEFNHLEQRIDALESINNKQELRLAVLEQNARMFVRSNLQQNQLIEAIIEALKESLE